MKISYKLIFLLILGILVALLIFFRSSVKNIQYEIKAETFEYEEQGTNHIDTFIIEKYCTECYLVSHFFEDEQITVILVLPAYVEHEFYDTNMVITDWNNLIGFDYLEVEESKLEHNNDLLWFE